MDQTNHPISSVDMAAVNRKVAWRLMPLIMVCYFFAFFDRINISFAKSQLQADIGLSNVAYGIGASAFVAGAVIFDIPSTMMLYRTGARRWIARIMISWGLATAAMVFVRNEWALYAVRFIIGAMEAGFAPGILFYLTLWFPSSFRGRVTSLVYVSTAFSGIIGAPLAGLILTYFSGLSGFPGWQWLFLLSGLPCVGFGLLVLFVFKDRIRDVRWLSKDEKSALASQISGQNRDIGEHSLLGAWKAHGFARLAFIYFLIQIGSYGFNFWGPDLIRSAGGGSNTAVGFLTAIPYVCGMIAMLVLGRISDKSGERRFFVAVPIAVAGLGFFAAGLFDKDIALLVVALAVIGGGVVATIPAFWALPPMMLTGAGAAGGIAMINTIGQIGGIVSPVMVGQVKDMTGSSSLALYAVGGACLLCALLLAFALPDSLRRHARARTLADARVPT